LFISVNRICCLSFLKIQLAINFIGILLICLVAVGFKTKLVSIVMVLWLFVLNIAMHDFWNESGKQIVQSNEFNFGRLKNRERRWGSWHQIL